ncbi:MAG: DUF2971 domain-containing protein [Proteobacteria bacterium]|nr:DUF2971 domain-containing protein [Burkholderiales bacterium]
METLFHYCPTSTFHSIIQNSSIWLSSLSLSNDRLEGRLISKALGKLAQRDDVTPDRIAQLEAEIRNIEDTYDGLGFCLSEDGDLLSQWRAYAADASGLSIGFDRGYLERAVGDAEGPEYRHLALDKVVYSEPEHLTLLEDMYQRVRGRYREAGSSAAAEADAAPWIAAGAADDQGWMRDIADPLYWELFRFIPTLYLLKSAAFREEREWRLHTIRTRGITGAYAHRPDRNRLVPYLKFLLAPECQPITTVVLGPKHTSDPIDVGAFLRTHGFNRVDVVRSEASYQ